MKILVTTCQNQINVLRCRNICFGNFLSFVIMPKVSSKNQLRWLEFFMCSMIIQERVILKNTVVSWCDPCFINMSWSHCQRYVRSCLSVKYHHKSSSWKLIGQFCSDAVRCKTLEKLPRWVVINKLVLTCW